jgi:hypothetical protein
MARCVLIFILTVALVIELCLALGGFFVPGKVLEAFKVSETVETLFLADVIAWLLLAVSLACGLALKWVLANHAAGWTLSMLLGIWWVGIGVGLFARFGIYDNLLLDSVKGAVIVASAWKSWPRA